MKFDFEAFLKELLLDPQLVVSLLSLIFSGDTSSVANIVIAMFNMFENIFSYIVFAVVMMTIIKCLTVITLFWGVNKEERAGILKKIIDKFFR